MASTREIALQFFLLVCVSSAPTRLRREKDLLTSLLKFYSTNVWPAAANLTVDVDLELTSINGPSKEEVLEVDGSMEVAWYDPRFTWRPQDWAGVSELTPDVKELWNPRITIRNARLPRIEVGGVARVDSRGNVRLRRDFRTISPCPPNSALFPFERQTCKLAIGSEFRNNAALRLRMMNEVRIETAKTVPVGPWLVLSVMTDSGVMPTSVDPRDTTGPSEYLVTVVLRRRADQLALLLIFPFICLSFIGSLLPLATRPGQRLTIALLFLLCMSVHLGVVALRAPGTAQMLPLLCVFLAIQMAAFLLFACTAILSSALRITERACEEEEDGGQSRCWQWLQGKLGGAGVDLVIVGLYTFASAVNVTLCLLIIPLAVFRVL